jgi:uncharacterized protein
MLDLRTAGLHAVCIVVATLMLPLSAQAQSFNCRYARSPDEVAICQNDRLSALDQAMSQLYFRIRNSLYGAERADLEAGQAEWLRSRRNCGSDPGCIADAYRRRIQELRAY